MTDKEIEKIREAMGSLPVDLLAFEVSHPTPPEQRIDEAMQFSPDRLLNHTIAPVVAVVSGKNL